jgi:hypothetical protein
VLCQWLLMRLLRVVQICRKWRSDGNEGSYCIFFGKRTRIGIGIVNGIGRRRRPS